MPRNGIIFLLTNQRRKKCFLQKLPRSTRLSKSQNAADLEKPKRQKLFHVEQTWATTLPAFGQDSATNAALDKFGAGAPVVVRRRLFLVVPARV